MSEVGLRVTANVTVMKINIHELYETIGNALLHGATFLLMNRFLPGGRGLAHRECLELTGEEVRQPICAADEVLEATRRPGSLGTEVPKCLVADHVTKHLSIGTRCSGGREFFAIDPSGRVRSCNHSPLDLGSWRDLSRILQEPYWRRFLFREFIPASCRGCDLAAECDGGCREAVHITGGALEAFDAVLPRGRDWRLGDEA